MDTPIAWLVIFIAIGSAIGGYFYARRRLKNAPSSCSNAEAVLQWEEMPSASVKKDLFGTLLLAIQTFGLIASGFILVYNAIQPVKLLIPKEYVNSQLQGLTLVIRLGGVAVMFFYFIGSMVFLFVQTFKQHRSTVFLSSDGVCYGKTYLTWDRFSHFRIDQTKQTIRLRSKFCPGLTAMILHPEPGESMENVVNWIRERLASQPVQTRLNLIRQKWTLLFCFLLAAFLTLAINLFLSAYPSPWSWFLQLVVAYGFFWLCARMIHLYYSFPSR